MTDELRNYVITFKPTRHGVGMATTAGLGIQILGDIPDGNAAIVRCDEDRASGLNEQSDVLQVWKCMQGENQTPYSIDTQQAAIKIPAGDMANYGSLFSGVINYQGTRKVKALGDGQTKVIVIDTGVESVHPDLNVNTAEGYTFYPDGGAGSDFDGHGTHVGGIVGAIENGAQVVGIASKAAIIPYRIFARDGRNGTWDAPIGAFQHLLDSVKPPAVVNCSWGGPSAPEALKNIVRTASERGFLIICSAGNTGGPVIAPANYDCTVAVSAVDQSKQKTSWSSFGEEVDFAQAGDGILSTFQGQSVKVLSGTSMASPQVTACAKLVWDVNPTWTAAQVWDWLAGHAEDAGVIGKDTLYGYGIASVKDLVGDTPLPPPDDDQPLRKAVLNVLDDQPLKLGEVIKVKVK